MISQDLANQLLSHVVAEKVRSAFNSVFQGIGELTKPMSLNDEKTAKLEFLKMIETSFNEVLSEQRTRVEQKVIKFHQTK